jgi:hypothetical protein
LLQGDALDVANCGSLHLLIWFYWQEEPMTGLLISFDGSLSVFLLEFLVSILSIFGFANENDVLVWVFAFNKSLL